MSSFIFIFLIFIGFSSGLAAICDDPEDDFADVQIIISVSAVEKSKFRIYWNHRKYIAGDSLAFYKGNPKEVPALSAIFTHELSESSGFVETGVPAKASELEIYHAALLRDGKIRRVMNLSPKPNWMEERKAGLGHLNLGQLFIPGSHGSGFYARPSDNILHPKFYTLKWTQTQSLSIKQQLEYGIRYLDIRPAWNGKEYTVNHAGIPMIPMSDVVNEVNEFLNNTNEILIVSFKEFPHGFSNNEDHRRFSLYIEEAFKRHLQPYGSSFGGTMTLKDFWESDKRLVIAYENSHYHHPSFWPRIRQYWANCRSIECLRSYLLRVHAGSKFEFEAYLHAAMTELTHNSRTGIYDAIALKSKSQLRKWADEVGSLIPEWYNDWNATANIVAVDYVLTSGIVDLAIYWNERRSNYCLSQ